MDAASDSARSSASAVIRESRTPLAISTSKSVTVGPATQSTTRAGMSKVASVSAIACAVERSSVSLALCFEALSLVLASRPMLRQDEALHRPWGHGLGDRHGLARDLGVGLTPSCVPAGS